MVYMKIFVKAKTNAKINSVEKLSDGRFKVSVTSAPERGKANQAILKLISKFLSIPKSRLKIVSGVIAKNKIIELT